MASITIHVVIADYGYEGRDSMCAFYTEAAAEAFCKECNDYHANMPNMLETDTRAGYRFKMDRWKKLHPASAEYSACESFGVVSIELKEAQ